MGRSPRHSLAFKTAIHFYFHDGSGGASEAPMASYPHIALIVETAKCYDRGLLRGIGRYINRHDPWSVYPEKRGAEGPDPALIPGLAGRRDHRAEQERGDGWGLAGEVRPDRRASAGGRRARPASGPRDDDAIAALAIDLAFSHGTTSDIRWFSWFRPFRMIDSEAWTVHQENRLRRRNGSPRVVPRVVFRHDQHLSANRNSPGGHRA